MLDVSRQLGKSSFAHNLRKYLWPELEWGGRTGELVQMLTR